MKIQLLTDWKSTTFFTLFAVALYVVYECPVHGVFFNVQLQAHFCGLGFVLSLRECRQKHDEGSDKR